MIRGSFRRLLYQEISARRCPIQRLRPSLLPRTPQDFGRETPGGLTRGPKRTRSSAAARRLSKRVDNLGQHARTGCMLHPSYPPAKLLWLGETEPQVVKAARRWMSIGEYLFLQFFGAAAGSTSMVSASGLWDQN